MFLVPKPNPYMKGNSWMEYSPLSLGTVKTLVHLGDGLGTTKKYELKT